MRWYHYVAYFFGGAFLANTLPHLGNGISGQAFQSPFASPPGVGLSSATVNVLWGLFNLAVAYLLICRVGSFNLRSGGGDSGYVVDAGPRFRAVPRRTVSLLAAGTGQGRSQLCPSRDQSEEMS
jgi:hypothetical protein